VPASCMFHVGFHGRLWEALNSAFPQREAPIDAVAVCPTRRKNMAMSSHDIRHRSEMNPGLVGWVSTPNQRGTADILWENALVLFVCVWVVLHHNLQSEHESDATVVVRKLRWTILAVFAPEMLTLFAIMQWNAANISVTEMNSLGIDSWTVTHAFYANAGGFVLQTPDFPTFPINATSIFYLCGKERIMAPGITKREIWDRSKADRFAKGLALLQTGWMLLQIIARAALKLLITPLELFTVAFILPTLATTYFWMNKPQNVSQPTVISVSWTLAELLTACGDEAAEPYVDTPMDFVEKPVWQGWRRRKSLRYFGGLERRPLTRIPNDYSPPPPTDIEATAVLWVVSVTHAVIHVLGWGFSFPTDAEMFIWRASSVTLVAVMVVGGFALELASRPWFDFSFSLLWIWELEAKRKTWARKWLFRICADSAYIIYIVARLLIFAEILLSFRALPPGAYDSIDWSAFWPHVS